LLQRLGLAALRAKAERGARVGWARVAGPLARRYRVRLILLDGAGHLPHLEAPRDLAHSLLVSKS
jgi:pimeloyl-ACP methyl ester carboxylesterase